MPNDWTSATCFPSEKKIIVLLLFRCEPSTGTKLPLFRAAMQLDHKFHPAARISSVAVPRMPSQTDLAPTTNASVEVGITSITKNQNHALALIPDEPPDKMPSIVHLSNRVKEIHNSRLAMCQVAASISRRTPGERRKKYEIWSCQTTPISLKTESAVQPAYAESSRQSPLSQRQGSRL